MTEIKKKADGHDVVRNKMIEYFDQKSKKKDIDAKMKLLKAELEAFAKENKSFFEDGQYTFDCCGYLRLGNETKAKLTKKFSLPAFARAFKGAVKREFNISFLKALFKDNGNAEAKARKLGLTLTDKEKFEIVSVSGDNDNE